MAQEFKKECCKKFEKKVGKTCKRCPLTENGLPKVNRKKLLKILRAEYKSKFD